MLDFFRKNQLQFTHYKKEQDLRKLRKHRTFRREKPVISVFKPPKSPLLADFKRECVSPKE